MAAVEFVVVAGLLAAMLFLIIDMGLMMSANLVLTQAAREGARRAAIEGGATPGAFQRIESQAAAGRLDLDRLQMDIKPKQASYGTIINVRVDYDYRFHSPFLRRLAGDPFPLRVEMSARSERLDPREP
ncbi:MAG TPA: TadE family protein [Sphingobacteriaceae bacterium]|nr:TadE family protein [Sphingobacteriaceae bacterium]